MHCTNCGNKLSDYSKFCENCGHKIHNEVSKTIHDNNDISSSNEQCQLCHKHAPIKSVDFSANIGMLVMRKERHIKGNLCKYCINKTFWNYTFINLFLGWWGTISFFATCIYMIKNIFQYLGTLSLKKQY